MVYRDEGVNFAVQKGVQISRSNVRYFKHNDMQDLERVLDDIRVDDLIVRFFLYMPAQSCFNCDSP